MDCAKALILNMPRLHQSGYAFLPVSKLHSDTTIRELEEFIQNNFRENITVEELASRAGMSGRNLIRRFKAATGTLPGAYLQEVRVAAARQLLERGGRSVERVGFRVGYVDTAFFRRVFKRRCGVTPAAHRERVVSEIQPKSMADRRWNELSRRGCAVHHIEAKPVRDPDTGHMISPNGRNAVYQAARPRRRLDV